MLFSIFKKIIICINNVLLKLLKVIIVKVPKEKSSFNNEILSCDCVRSLTLQIFANEINMYDVKGDVAELGVYRGEFAKLINSLFSDRRFLLLDTFEGFDNKDIDVETTKNLSKEQQDFTNTSIEVVKNKMKYPSQCVFIKGLFPDSVKDYEDRKYCFVSIDADLYNPIYAGLCYFYDKLSNGGRIMIHDYNNSNYPGARQAVFDFCKEKGIGYSILPDIDGSAVVSKPFT